MIMSSSTALIAVSLWCALQPTTEEKAASLAEVDEECDCAEERASTDRDEDSLDATEFSIGGGLMVTGGNSNVSTFNAGSDLRIRRGAHQSTTKLLFNGGSTSEDADDLFTPTISNQLVRSRYDYLLRLDFALFLQVQWRRDPFQGLDTRVNVDPGVAYYILDRASHRLWVQAGYDFQYDIRRSAYTLESDDEGNILLDDQGLPTVIAPERFPSNQVRLFLGSENRIRDQADINVSVEYLQNFVALRRYIVNGELGVVANIKAGVSIGFAMIVRYENRPLPRVERTDVGLAFNILYKLNNARLDEYERARARRRKRRAARP